ncbi:MAG: acetate--CoA ligase family protein, partial [Proteobacteria bacterium]|nr:acetate--CoA ligase family protein [Pseudomonadota bacterium]
MSDKSTSQIIEQIFYATSVAVVGASADPTKYGYMTLDCILRGAYEGRVYPVNPKAGEILGVKAYSSIREIPEIPDVAVILVPAKAIPKILKDMGEKGIHSAVITTAGYSEVGRDDLQQELVNIAKEYNIRIVGPNIEGFIYMPNKLNAQFFPVVQNTGPLATVSQSGSLTNGLVEWADKEALGISAAINLGNQVDICEADFIEYLSCDNHVKAIAMYLEGVKDGRAFLGALKSIAGKKPVVILKAGRSRAGQKSVASHTASLAGEHDVFCAACRQYGAIPVKDLQSLYDYGKLLATMPVPRGNRLLIISSSGGIGVLAVDEAQALGICLPKLPRDFVDELKLLNLSPLGSLSNPIDLAAIWAEEFRKVALLADKYDIADVFLINFGDPIEGAGEMIKDLKKRIRAGIAVAYMGGAQEEEKDRPKLHRAGIPVFPTPERAIRAISAAMTYGKFSREIRAAGFAENINKHKDLKIRDRQGTTKADFVLEPDAVSWLGEYGIAYPDHCFVKTMDEAVIAAQKIGYPVVLKVVSSQVPHKSDSGGVRVDIKDTVELQIQFKAIKEGVAKVSPTAKIEGMMVCKQAEDGLELIVGAIQDPVFGPIVMVGLGGIFTEILTDTAFRVAPISPRDAKEMIRELKGFDLLTGARMSKKCDIHSLEKLLIQVSSMICTHPEIQELDLNPVRIYETDFLVLDVRILK